MVLCQTIATDRSRWRKLVARYFERNRRKEISLSKVDIAGAYLETPVEGQRIRGRPEIRWREPDEPDKI